MEEKILIKSKCDSFKKGLLIFFSICFLATIIWCILGVSQGVSNYHHWMQWNIYKLRGSTPLSHAFIYFFEGDFVLAIIPACAGLIISLPIYARMHSFELTVTDKRVFGKAGLNNAVDILFDDIKFLKKVGGNSITLITDSSSDTFRFLTNRDDIYNTIREKIGLTKEEKEFEQIKQKGYRKRCNVCGKIICYTLEDLEKNRQHSKNATISSLTTMMGAMSGHFAAGATSNQTALDEIGRIIDYNKCPSCGSRDLVDLSDEDIKNIKTQENRKELSITDELKKYKELLDSEIITQEEFDAKKKELLGL